MVLVLRHRQRGELGGHPAELSLVKKYTEMRAGFPQPDTRAYGFEFPWNSGPRDYWQIGGSLGFLVDADLYIHPLEWFDLALGVFCIDFTGDDLTFNSFQ